MKIAAVDLNFEREALSAPFGFKGGYLSELWQTVAKVQTASGISGVGTGVQSVLWSDPRVFIANSESAGNAFMFAVTAEALKILQGQLISSVDQILQMLPELIGYACRVTGYSDLKTTFALNALVPVDNALHLAFAMEQGISSFDALVPTRCRAALSSRNERLASVPTVGYGLSVEAVSQLVDGGSYILKIKIGSDPQKDGNQDSMLEWDKKRITDIHRAVGNRSAGPGNSEQIRYYLDANQRYESLSRIIQLVDHIDSIGALGQTILLEEPFPEDVKESVVQIPITVVADESAHTDVDAAERIDLGYGAIALKPVAKTLSMTFKIAEVAHQRGVSCFCADLTVNPLLLEWNRSIAARCRPLPGLTCGLLENNGVQNYRNWDRLISYHPHSDASWIVANEGEFRLDDEFFSTGGGLFMAAEHYQSLVR